MGNYCIVLEGTGLPESNHYKIRTWSSFLTKESFEDWCEGKKLADTIIAKGVTQKEALRLTEETPIKAYVYSAIRSAHSKPELLPQSYDNFVKAEHAKHINKKALTVFLKRLIADAVSNGKTAEMRIAYGELVLGLL